MTKKLSIPVVSDVPPDASYTAGQVLHRIMGALPDEHFEFIWVNQSNLPGHISIPENCSISRVFGFELRGIWLRISLLFRALAGRWPSMRRVAVIVRAAMWTGKSVLVGIRLGFALRRSSSRLVWFVVQGEKTILAYSVAAWISGKKIVLQQWDPLSWWMTHRGYPRRLFGPMHKLLARLERLACMNIVPSDAWQRKLVAENKRCMRLDNFFDDPTPDDETPVFLSDSNAVHAVFVGQFYSNTELERLVSEICLRLRKIDRRLVLHYFGSGSPAESSGGYKLINHGALPRDALIKRISKWDVALLPYPTESKFHDASTLSFPSKSRVYLAAGLPIVAWALKDSSPHKFYSAHYSDNYCNAASGGDLEAFVLSIVTATAEKRRQRYSEARRLVLEQFSHSSELVPFRDFLLQNA